MKMLQLILNEMRSYSRVPSVIFLSLLFPSLCTFFLGTLLESVMESDDMVGDISIAYSVEDSRSAAAFEEFIITLEKDSVLTADKVDEIPENIGDYSAMLELADSEIIIYNGKDAIQNRTVKALVDGFNQTAGAYTAVAVNNPQAMREISLPDEDFTAPKDFGRTRTMMDYYAVAMTVVIVVFGAIMGGSFAYSNERTHNTLARLDSAPVGKATVYFSKIIGSIPMMLLQSAVVMLVSTLCFGAHFAATLPQNLLLFAMFVCSSLAILAVGILLDLFIGGRALMPILGVTGWAMLFFSGAFQPDISLGALSEYLPPRIILNAAFDLTVFSRTEQAVSVIAWSLGIFAVLIFIGWIKVSAAGLRRKKI